MCRPPVDTILSPQPSWWHETATFSFFAAKLCDSEILSPGPCTSPKRRPFVIVSEGGGDFSTYPASYPALATSSREPAIDVYRDATELSPLASAISTPHLLCCSRTSRSVELLVSCLRSCCSLQVLVLTCQTKTRTHADLLAPCETIDSPPFLCVDSLLANCPYLWHVH